MTTIQHADVTSVHLGALITDTDPGAVGAGKLWIDITGSPPYPLKVRNALNVGWDNVGQAGTGAAIFITDVDPDSSAGAFGLWINLGEGPPYPMRIRNSANSNWDFVEHAGGGVPVATESVMGIAKLASAPDDPDHPVVLVQGSSGYTPPGTLPTAHADSMGIVQLYSTPADGTSPRVANIEPGGKINPAIYDSGSELTSGEIHVGSVHIYDDGAGGDLAVDGNITASTITGGTSVNAVGNMATSFGHMDAAAGFQIAGTPVLTGQGAAVADATDGTDVITRLNDLLAQLRAIGIVAT
jgi:hypothetical protein